MGGKYGVGEDDDADQLPVLIVEEALETPRVSAERVALILECAE